MEANTAVKPFLLEHLLARDEVERLMYLDPDLKVLRRLDHLDEVLDRSVIALTPRLTEPIDDGRWPDELDVLRTGAYNLGFLALKRHETVTRLLGSWKRRVEVVLVDNASTDGSLELVTELFPCVEIMRLEPNLGFAVANNRGAAQAGGEWLLLLNNHAWVGSTALSAMRRRLEVEPGLGLVAPRLLSPDGRPHFGWSPDRGVLGEALQLLLNRWEAAPWLHAHTLSAPRRAFGPGWYTGACMMLRAQAFAEGGGFDEVYSLHFEDADPCVRLRRAGWLLD